jgi:flagellin
MAGQSFSVLNNLASVDAQRNLYFSNLGLNKTLGRLSSGKRIVEAGDDAAGLAIASGLKADYTALSQAVRNANDGIAIVQIADGALSKLTDMLVRCVTLAEQSASDTVGTDEKVTLNLEYQELMDEINRVIDVANFKGERLFSVTSAYQKSIYVGDTQLISYITISIGGPNGSTTASMGLARADAAGAIVSASAIDTRERAVWVLQALQGAIASVSRWRGVLGAQQNRLINSVAIIQVQSQNLQAAESVIMDANMAEEVVNMTKFQILLQSGMSSLAQANASAQLVLQLFR